jgi:phosphomannomutase
MDGDSDRPLLVDGRGIVRSGDLIGLITSELLGVTACAFPVSSSDTLSFIFTDRGVEHTLTKIGSPYVIDEVDKFSSEKVTAGWEVNGGYMVGSNATLGGRPISPLMTRDAILPLLAVLLTAQRNGESTNELFESIQPKRYTSAGLIDMPNFDDCTTITSKLSSPNFNYGPYFTADMGYGVVEDINLIDGVRLTFSNGDIAHVRGSGNAPQLRVYSVANTLNRAEEIVQQCIKSGGIFERLAVAQNS